MLRRVLVVLHAVIGIAAVGAGQAFVRDPSGVVLGMDVAWLRASPFRDYLIPGLFLLVVIGGTNLLSAAALWQRHEQAPRRSLATSLLLVAWVAIQTGILGFRHWSQAIWWLTFVVMGILAMLLTVRSSDDSDDGPA